MLKIPNRPILEVVVWLRKKMFHLFGVRTLGSLVIAPSSDGEVLLVRHPYRPHEWNLPGGGLKKNESFRDAAVREAGEETGLHLEPNASVTLQSIYLRRSGRWVDHVAVFVIENWELRPNSTWEIAEVRAFPLNGLPVTLRKSHKRRIDEWLGKSEITDAW